MEIIILNDNNDNKDNSDNNAFALNNILKTDINKYELLFNTVDVNESSKFILSAYQNSLLVLRFEYLILGSYNKSRNVWIWADLSFTLNKSIVSHVKNIRINLQNNIELTSERTFIEHDYSVLPTTILMGYIVHIGNKLFTDSESKYQIVTFSHSDDIIDFYVSKRILFERVF